MRRAAILREACGGEPRVYLRHSIVRKDGKAHTYWRLVRSVRRNGKVVQETVAQLGELDAEGRAKAQALARQITGRARAARAVRSSRARRTRRCRCGWIASAWSAGAAFGDVWLGWTLWRALRLDDAVRGAAAAGPRGGAVGGDGGGPGDRAAVRAVERAAHRRGLVPHARRSRICWACRPSRSTTTGCTGRLTSCCRTRQAIEQHLVKRLGELFELDYDLLLYDVTSTYFEGQAAAQPAGPARLQPRPPARLQAGLHRAGGDARGHAAGLRGVRRQPRRRDHGRGDRRDDGGALRDGRAASG